MKAIVAAKYWPPEVLQLKDVEKPTPKNNDVLVKVHAASANPVDWHRMRGAPFLVRLEDGLRKPKKHETRSWHSRLIEAVGVNVKQFRPGDAVFREVNWEASGIPLLELASFGEYVCISED